MSMDAPVTVLIASQCPDDHITVAEVMSPYQWAFHHTYSFFRAKELLQDQKFAVVICECDLMPWKDLLVGVLALPKPPSFIVASANADDRLWAEALNWGVYHVRAKPFQPTEVLRTLALGALRWEFNMTLRSCLQSRSW